MTPLLDVRAEVAEALAARRPVVALESAVIAHGLPAPHNLEAAGRMARAVRAAGAVPATVALLDGRVRVGLDESEVARLAAARAVAKVSRRDLAPVLAAGRPGATTVAATLVCAARAGIRVFATGGIGGVHRAAERSFDVSADLVELARSPVAVVCAGAKAVLDLPRTLEALETAGVPVIGYRTARFPAFFARDSGLALEAQAGTPAEVAAILRAQWTLGLGGGVVVANPPPEDAAIARDELERWIAAARRARP